MPFMAAARLDNSSVPDIGTRTERSLLRPILFTAQLSRASRDRIIFSSISAVTPANTRPTISAHNAI